LSGRAARDGVQRARNEWKKILEFIAQCDQDNDSHPRVRKILLELKVLIGSQEYLKTCISGTPQKFSVLESGPPDLLDGPDIVPG
jgi:hypothetical protein